MSISALILQPPSLFKKDKGFTLIEVIIVLALLGTMVFLFATNYRRSYSNQALRSSVESFATNLRAAHVLSREIEGEKEWGIKKIDDNSYTLVSRTEITGEAVVEKEFHLDGNTNFEGDFPIIWFTAGSGEVENSFIIKLQSKFSNYVQVEILKSGLVEIGEIL